jgi:hypothetical protein
MSRYGIAAALVFALGGCSDKPSSAELPATEDVLAQYQTIHIGSEKLTFPTIALLSSTTDSSLTLGDGTRVPIASVLSQRTNGTRVSRIDINIHSYRELQDYSLDKYAFVSSAFCKRLSSNWERDQCAHGLYNGRDPFYPQYFQIVERGYLSHSSDKLFSIAGEGSSGGQAARGLLAQTAEASVACEPKQHPLCTAVMPIRRDLVAVWATRKESLVEDKNRIRWILDQYLK